jgi:hypothetical protein
MAEVQANQVKEIPNDEIKKIGENTPKAVEAICIRNDSIKLLCELKTEIL